VSSRECGRLAAPRVVSGPHPTGRRFEANSRFDDVNRIRLARHHPSGCIHGADRGVTGSGQPNRLLFDRGVERPAAA
jgi:hypothetical protein